VQLQADLRNANAELQQKLHREPTSAELADHLCLSIEKVQDNIAHDTQLLSADRESGEEGSTPFIDMLPSDFPLPDAGLLQSTLCRDVEAFVSTLPDRERVLMELSYGLNGHLPLSMVDIAETLGMTREWTRKIRFKVLETLRQKLQHQYTYEDRNL
jgi:RNA polymerase primary sigma factor